MTEPRPPLPSFGSSMLQSDKENVGEVNSTKGPPKLAFNFSSSIFHKSQSDVSANEEPHENEDISMQVDDFAELEREYQQTVTELENKALGTNSGESRIESSVSEPVSESVQKIGQQREHSEDLSGVKSATGLADIVNVEKEAVKADNAAPPVPSFGKLFSNVPTKSAILTGGKTVTLRPKTTSIFSATESATTNASLIDMKKLFLEMEQRDEMKAKLQKKSTKKRRHGLWTEKYRPHSFLDLVGNERANRQALKWLKHWSTAVYGEDITEELENLPSNRYLRNLAQNGAASDSKSKFAGVDPLNRPKKRILLLHGPPGLGKTTLAHLMAKQLGYDVLEINASDERAGEQVRDKIFNGLETHTFSGNPTCIVADEVDGAGENGFIKILVDLVFKDIYATKRFQNRAKGDKLLLRPIIAICNDIYAPVLEKLKPHCEIVPFKRPTDAAVIERLEKICLNEKVDITTKTLSQIVKISNNDLRSCLNLLQFNSAELSDSSDYTKDTTVPWFKLVDSLFNANVKQQKSLNFQRLQKMILGHPNIDKVIKGCFDSYHDTVHNDPALISKSVRINDWLFFGDLMESNKYQLNGDLESYTCFVALEFFTQFAKAGGRSSNNNSGNQINTWEFFEKRRVNKDIIHRVISSELAPRTFTLLNNTSIAAAEILPLVNNYLLNPKFSQNAQNGQSRFQHSLEVIESMHLKVELVTGFMGNKNLALIPNMESLTSFKEPIDLKRQQFLRQVMIEYEKMQNDAISKKRSIDQVDTENEESGEPNAKLASHSFFDNQQSNAKPKEKGDIKIWVKYHEGFSNAVRKNVRWEDLWV